ncbi:ABC transporter permease [Winogradskyella aurantiaca]|uniref:ABC transporter permease n=1 Tax=Winogradskyella aurantiaca TaxID=2219558 RepID=UPI000E1E1B68|nr:FtsX-like permease family protein [Winogradskyella aurantiaca]
MAWRDAKASKGRLFLFMASIILGIGAVVSIQLFSTNLKNNIQLQSKALMGADYIIDTRQEPNERSMAIIDSLGPDAFEINFVSMIAFPKQNGTRLVQVRGLEGDFPFYGSIDTQPEVAASSFQDNGGALVDATLMLQYGVQPGDSIKVGEVVLPISGALKSVPGSTAVSTSVAPPVIIPYKYVEDTQLIQFGSRKEYQYFFKVADSVNIDQFERKIEPILESENLDIDTHTSTSRRLGRRYDNVGKFLNLVAFIALLLGCIGIASSVHIYIKEKLRSIAVLKCMGATRRQSFLIFLIQIAGIGFVGGIIGTVLGVFLQELFPYILKDFLPFDVTISIEAQPIVMGLILGLCISILFALLPLMRTWYVSPLEVLRVGAESKQQISKARSLIIIIILGFLFSFSYWLLRSVTYSLAFVGGVVLTFGVLSGIAYLSMKMIKRYFPRSWGFTSRQSLLNLFRPNNQTLVLVIAIGLGSFLISTLYFTKDILLVNTDISQTEQDANIILLDVQSQQREKVVQTFQEKGLPVIDNVPIVTMRMHKIKNQLVNELRTDTTRQVRGWILNHEFRTTYRDELVESETLQKGEWIPELRTGEHVKISISDNIANDAKVTVGDTIVFNVQGVLMETTVGSIRQVDWSRVQLNFSIVFPKGVLEQAPQFSVLSTNAANEQESADLQRELVAKYPNISILDLRQVLNIVEDILNKVSWIINFMAFFSILTGIIVLIGSVRNSKYQRIKESVLLRTIGAKNQQILKISALEYLFLGLIGTMVGILLALFSSLMLALFVFQEPFVPSSIPFTVFLPGITLIVMLIGLSNIQGVLRSSPLEVLRREV